MASTILGASGRHYVRGDVLHKNEDGKPTIFKALCGNEPVVFKQESKSIFDLSRRLADEFAGSRRLRMPIDFIPEERIVVYPYFADTLLDLIRADPEFPPAELKKVLRSVGEAIQEFHTKGWLHLDVKPDNVFVNWTCEGGNKTVTSAALGDFGIAYKQVGTTPLRTGVALGNFMWRSPEGQTGSGITKASDIFSYGLVCIYALGGGDLLLLEDEKVLAELAELGITPEEDILTRHFTYFGPVNEGLLKQVDSREHRILKRASATADLAVKNQPDLRFEVWGKELGEAALDMISGMTKLDPTARLDIDQVLRCSWWQEP
ncbi:kinase-like protein [Coniochaeta ligniaria NRRL 30616]|uniref:Kinase-like protein n=1 Tax=Coniochaeta ligniaria NRRL 30616 TaxID=1408157 RepID=A0A1J7IS18_9PEZI|nr:kinase-like protein [Coniochaeta ligniaria NRRL 30616]